MWMFAEYVDRSGEVLARAEAEIYKEADLADLVGSLSERFRISYPERSLQAALGKAQCMIRIGSAAALPESLTQGAFATNGA
jgi:hypothetical protein